MVKMNKLLFVAFVAFLVSLSSGCTYNIASMSALTSTLAGQSGWTSVPTLCFAAGTYTLTQEIILSASQKWVGPQQGVDPTCGRLINPPCSRYTSASNSNATSEAVFVPQTYGISTSSSLNLTMDGFTVAGTYSGFLLGSTGTFSITVSNTYIYESLIQASYATLDHCYIGFPSSGNSLVITPVLSIATNNFFYKVGLAQSGAITAIGNTFVLMNNVASVTAPSYFENNMFYAMLDSVISDSVGQTSFKNNTFWNTASAYNPSVPSILDFNSNCFVDINPGYGALSFLYDFNTTNAVFYDNYFGNKDGPQIHIFNSGISFGNKFGTLIGVPDQIFTFNFSPKRLHFTAPNVCPHEVFSLTVKPSNIVLGETVNITFSFELDPLLVGAGITPSMFNGVSVQSTLNVADITGVYSFPLKILPGGTSQANLNPSTQTSWSTLYTFQPGDLLGFTEGTIASPPNYFVHYSLNSYSGPFGNIFSTSAYASITITPKVPLSCYNLTLSLNKNATAGPLPYSFQELGCNSSNWQIVSVNTTNLFSFDDDENLLINTGANLSGVRLTHYQVSFYAIDVNGQSNLAHNVVTKITIVNHNPVINSANFTWTYPRITQTFPNWNILSNCSDQDGDTVTVVQIQRNRARTNTSVVQLDDLTLHFVPEKVVVSVLSTGQITFTSPSNSIPVTEGSPLSLFWKEDISFQFQITDGDIIKQYAWGIADINYFLSN